LRTLKTRPTKSIEGGLAHTRYINKKKAELHLHLDGSLRASTVRELAVSEGVLDSSLTTQRVKEILKVDDDSTTLVDYLKEFELPLKVMQTKEGLARTAFELIEDLASENYIYVEIRFAPHIHLAKGLTLAEVVEAALSGVARGQARCGVRAGLILCILRHMPLETGMEIVALAEKYRNRGVLGIDLAGDEKHYPPGLFKPVFDIARERKINITIHAGESAGPASVTEALDMGASRIGHGVRAVEDKQVLERLAGEGIALEVCPTSNLQTRVYEDFSKYPLKQLIQAGVAVSLNTDNRTVSDTNLDREAELITRRFGITQSEIDSMLENSIKKCFLPEKERAELLGRL
jgi:adenosine deaminase